jgi:hypothetical protein
LFKCKICPVFSISKFDFPAPIDLAKAQLGINFLGCFWASTKMKQRLLLLGREL